MIGRDYEIENGELILSIRKAILYYFKKRLRLDVAEALDLPKEMPVVVLNLEEFEKALKEASS